MSLQGEYESLTFAELKHLKSANIPRVKVALRISSSAASSLEVSGAEILHLWIEKLLKAYTAAQFDVEDWIQLTNFLGAIFQQILDTASPPGDNANNLELSSWMRDSLELLKWFQPLIPELNIAIISSVLVFALDTVNKFLTYYQKWGKNNDLKRQLQDTLAVHSFILKVLNENVNGLKVDSEREFSNLTELIASLCEVGEHASPLDIQMIVETWKCVVKITSHCAKWSPSFATTIATEKSTNSWAQRPFKYLLKEVSRNVEAIYKEDALKQPIERVEKYLRVTNFYLKLLQMLTMNFSHAEFPVAKEFFDVLYQSTNLPKYLIGTRLAEILRKYVLIAINDVLQIVYKSCDLLELLLSHLRKCKEVVSFELAVKYLQASVSGRDCKFIDSNILTYTIIFKRLATDPTILSDTEKYSSTIELYAALTILSETTKLKTYFRENILSADFATAHASTDVLLIVLRCRFDQTKDADVLREFRYWRKCNETFTLMSDNPRQLHIKRLLRHTFKLCQSSSSTISNNALWDQYPEWQLIPSNYRFFRAVGLANTSSDDRKLQSLIIRLTDELFDLILKCDTVGCSIDNYYKMVINIELLATVNVTPKKELVTQLFQLILRLNTDANVRIHDFAMFLNAFYNLAATYADSLTESTLQPILDCVKNKCNPRAEMLSLPEIDFLNACCNNANPILKETAAAHILAKLDATRNASKNAPSQCQMYKAIEQQISLAVVHVCDTSNQSMKRQRQEDENEGPSLKIIVNDIFQNSHNIVKLSSQLDSVDFDILNSVVNNLKIVLDKKQ